MYGKDRRGGSGGGFGRGGGGGGGFSTPPIKVGEEHDVTISDVGAKGDGITKIDNFVVFVKDGKKGEKCRIRITEVANKFAIGEKIGGSDEAAPAEDTAPAEEASEDAAEESTEDVQEETPEEKKE